MSTAAAAERWHFLDVARGVMVLMLVFGHADVFFNPLAYGDEGFGGRYPPVVDVASFVARIVRIPGAPGFFFLSGITLAHRYAHARARGGEGAYRVHVLKRAAFFLLLEPLVIGHLWTVDMPERMLAFGVISCFGLCFLASIAFSRMGPTAALLLGAGIVLAKELVRVEAPTEPLSVGALAHGFLWEPAYYRGYWYTSYPVAGWLPPMLFGYALGHALRARSRLPAASGLVGGAALGLVGFVALRSTTTFGTLGQAAPRGVIEFFTMSKYPPSLQLLVCALSLVLAILALGRWLEGRRDAMSFRLFAGIGRQAFFVYLVLALAFGVPGAVLGLRSHGSLALAVGIFAVSLWPVLRLAEWYDAFKRRYRSRFPALGYV